MHPCFAPSFTAGTAAFLASEAVPACGCGGLRYAQISTKVLREEYPAGPRRIAGYLAKDAPTQTLIEPGRLEINRVDNAGPAASMPRLLLRHRHHAGSDPGATKRLRQIHEVDGQNSK